MPTNKSPSSKCINSTINKVIKLVEVAAFSKASKSAIIVHPVRVMMIYPGEGPVGEKPKDTVGTLQQIAQWSGEAGRTKEFKELMQSLVLFAEGKASEETRRLEKTKLDENIWEIKAPGQRMRLFAFMHNDQVIIISGHYQKHGKATREERDVQNRAIQNAIARRKMFLEASLQSEGIYLLWREG